MAHFTKFEKDVFPGGLKIRYLNANCYEIKLPNGKTIVTDPFLPREDVGVPLWERFACGIYPEHLEGCDYALISHTHGDHCCSVPECFERFNCLVMCHSNSAIYMTTKLMIPQQFVFPIDNNQHYEFDDFMLDTSVGRHVYNDVIDEQGHIHRLEKLTLPGMGTLYEELDVLGSLFNTDYVITTNNNIRIGFCTGTFDDFARNALKGKGCNIFMRQCGWEMHCDNYQKVAEEFMVTGAEILLPLHHEREYGHLDMQPFANEVNEYLAEHNYPGRMMILEQKSWYKVGMRMAIEK